MGAFALFVGLTGCGNPEGTLQLPEQGSTTAAEVDWVYYFIFWTSVVSFVLILGTMLYFVWKYHRSRGHVAVPTGHHTKLELFWTFSPLIVLALMFHWGFQGYTANAVAPSNAEQIRLYSFQWGWQYVYPNGGTAPGYQLVVPDDAPVRLTMTSRDVIHSFFIPAFRIKRDTVPGMFTTQWFQVPDPKDDDGDGVNDYQTQARALDDGGQPLECESTSNNCPEGYACRPDLVSADGKNYCYEAHQVFCTEYCGAPAGDGNLGHSAMYGSIHVVSRAEYETFQESLIGPPPECMGLDDDEKHVCWGNTIYAQQNCAGLCHNGAAAPNLAGIWGRTEQLQGIGAFQVIGEAGDEYLRESIMAPNARRVEGYSAQMPQYGFNDAEVDALVAFLKQLEE